MGEPYRYLKKLVKIGNSLYVLMPVDWLKKNRIKKALEVVMEIYDDKIVITPTK